MYVNMKKHPQPRNKPGQKPHHKPPARPHTKSSIKADLWGSHAVQAAWLNPDRDVRALYITESALKDFSQSAPVKRPPPMIVDKAALDHALPKGAVHQGIALDCPPLEETFLNDLIIRAGGQPKTVLLMLDQVTDPHNVGAILRSACAFGAAGMIMQKKHAPELSGVLAKTACGAVEHVPVAYETNLTRSLETLQENGFFVIGLDERGEDIAGLSVPDKCVLVLGAEGPGLRRLVKEQCDTLARLPMNGPMPSINVSNAAAVALYALSV
ncbi:MAG: 23S rRNA (guanosine(2251)-2'-O)-methyltransferase RlmB [Rhodospirillales bacterium]|nr:23S rRNA (guanosine(2251)-2'-O)-methyltransferase RlmB [Rhodospirillales bacterium]